MYKTKDFKITMLGVIPVLKDETGYLKPQDLISLSALMTFKGKAVKDLYNEALEKGQDIEQKVKTIIRKSSLRGHASMATTPAIAFTYEASKFIDSLMTGMVFSSSLMASGRRTDTVPDDIVLPSTIEKNAKAKNLYIRASIKNIEALNYFLENKIIKDDASKVLQYGIYGTGIIVYPIESLIAFKNEIQAEGEWMPEEAKMFIEEIEKHLEEMGVDLVYTSRELAARNTLPYPNAFKDPNRNNIVRDYINEYGINDDLTQMIDFSAIITKSIDKEAKKIVDFIEAIFSKKGQLDGTWRRILSARHVFMRDFSTAINLKVLSSVSWRVWGDKRRHRTVQMTADSLYYSLERCRKTFEKLKENNNNKSLSNEEIKEIDRVFTIPLSIKNNKKLLYLFLERAFNSVETYFILINKYNVKPSDAIFIIPRGIRVDVIQNFDLFNLISGYYPIRTCSTVESQLRPLTLKEMAYIKEKLIAVGLSNVAKLIVTKCNIPGFCLEEKNCPVIKGLVKDYSDELHEQIKNRLDEEFEERLVKIQIKTKAG